VRKDEVIEYLAENLKSKEYKNASTKDRAEILYDLFVDCMLGESELPEAELETNDWVDWAAAPGTDDNLEVDDLVENEDGSAQMTIRMSHETLVFYAQIGLLKTLEDAAKKTLEELDEQDL
jgi:hypothetical protein